MRTALLNAVSHDLRTPDRDREGGGVEPAQPDVDWTEADRQELLANADDALDRLTELVTNLLDLSRLQAGVLSVVCAPVGARGRRRPGPGPLGATRTARIELDVPVELPEVLADAGLLERVVANLVQNALRYSPAGQPVRVAASSPRRRRRAAGDRPRARAYRTAEREPVFAPFQRRDDHATSDGGRRGARAGHRARLHRGDARHDRTLEDTPGGGLTAVVALPQRRDATPASAGGRRSAARARHDGRYPSGLGPGDDPRARRRRRAAAAARARP